MYLEGPCVFQDKVGSQGLQPCSLLLKLLLRLFTLPDDRYAPQTQQAAQLHNCLTHLAVGSIQHDTVSWLHTTLVCQESYNSSKQHR